MNKLSVMAKSIVIAMGVIGIAYADNHPTLYAPLSSWSGLYAGIDAGFIFNNVQLRSQQLGFTNPGENCNTNAAFSSFFPGVGLGFMYQFSNHLVSGIEANVSFNRNQTYSLGCSCAINPNVADRFSFRNQRQSSIKGRVGRALDWNKNKLLPYLTAGASYAKAGLTYTNEGGDYYSKNTSQAGVIIGAGIEWSFRKNWSLRAEYSYINYGNTIKLKIPCIYGLVDPNGNARIDLSSNGVVVAINYWI